MTAKVHLNLGQFDTAQASVRLQLLTDEAKGAPLSFARPPRSLTAPPSAGRELRESLKVTPGALVVALVVAVNPAATDARLRDLVDDVR